MNFVLFSANVASIIQAVEAMATAAAATGVVTTGSDKLKSVIALVESAGASVAAFIPGLEALISSLVQQYNDSGLFKKITAVAAQ